MSKKIIPGLLIIAVIVVIIITFFVGEKKLALNDDIVTNAYQYLGKTDINQCGGLQTYTTKEFSQDKISLEDKLCMAYYNLAENQKEIQNLSYTKENSNSSKICEVGEQAIFLADDTNNCQYEVISKDTIANIYKAIYNVELTENNQFYINEKQICYFQDDNYLCGDAPSYNYTFTQDATIYRLLDKATISREGTLKIYDYYLRVTSDNKCYLAVDSDSADETCSNALNENTTIDANFIHKYAQRYLHTFKSDDGNISFHYLNSNQEE